MNVGRQRDDKASGKYGALAILSGVAAAGHFLDDDVAGQQEGGNVQNDVPAVHGNGFQRVRNRFIYVYLALRSQRTELYVESALHGLQQAFQFGDVVPVPLDQKVGGRRIGQLGISQFHDIAITVSNCR